MRGERRKPRTFVFLGMLLFLLQPAAAETLKEAIDLALAHDRSLVSARESAGAARLEALAAERSQLPVLNAGGRYQYCTAEAETTLEIPGLFEKTLSMSPQHTTDFSVGFTWAPFTGFARKADVESKHLAVTLAENDLDTAEAQTAMEAISAYRQAQRSLLMIETIGSGRRRVELQIEQTSALEKQGMAQKVDVLSLAIAKLDYDQQLIATRARLEDALDQLEALTGKRIEVEPAPTDSPVSTIAPLEGEKTEAIRALDIRRNMLLAGRRAAASKHYPTVALSGNLHYGLPGVDPVDNEWMLYGTAGVSFSWSYDWGGTAAAVRSAKDRLSGLAADKAAARERIELRYNSAVRDWKATKEALEVLEAALDLAEVKMGIVKSQYEQGLASTTEFNEANIELTQAELNYRGRLLALLLKTNQIDAMSGRSIEQWSVTP
jgi:outer membrane protein